MNAPRTAGRWLLARWFLHFFGVPLCSVAFDFQSIRPAFGSGAQRGALFFPQLPQRLFLLEARTASRIQKHQWNQWVRSY
jgi:hypothetical protein